jgi:hypothetical protein
VGFPVFECCEKENDGKKIEKQLHGSLPPIKNDRMCTRLYQSDDLIGSSRQNETMWL